MPATIIEEPHQIVVDKIPSISYRDGRDSLVLAANAAAFSFNRSLSYSMLKGLSGLAFRLIFHQDWHRFSPDALCGYDHTEQILNALGVYGTLLPADRNIQLARETSRDHIISSLREGYPVVAMHLMEYEDWGVIAGISTDDKLLCQTPHNESDDLAENIYWPSMLLRITGEGVEQDQALQFIASLRLAAKLFATNRFGPFFSGRAAYRFWISSLQDTAVFEHLEERVAQPYDAWVRDLLHEDKDNFAHDVSYTSQYLERAHVNAWRLESLIDARQSAADYLAQQAERLTGKAGARITRAAKIYSQLAELLTSVRPYVSWEWNLDAKPWTADMRMAQAQMLSTALELETAAVKEIRIFLSKLA